MNIGQLFSLGCETLDKLGKGHLKDNLGIAWNNRYTSRMGTYSPRTGMIQLSRKVYDIAPESEQKQTLMHEVCHMVVDYETRRAGLPAVESHGHLWQSFMHKLGLVARRCHKVETKDLKRRVKVYCGCEKPKEITSNRYTRMLKGSKYHCTICNKNLSFFKSKVI